MPNSSKHFTFLDGWRGLAIIGVLVDHFLDPPYFNTGRFGVELFFVLSGRLMAEILFVRETPLGEFFRRRISRVWPALFVFVLVVAAEIIVMHHPRHLVYPLAALTFTSNYLSAAGHRLENLDHMWSLCIEEHTYLFLGLLALMARKFGANVIAICLGVALFCMANGAFQTLILHHDYFAVYWRTDARAASILLACGVYLAFRQYKALDSYFSGGAAALWFGLAAVMLSLQVVPDPIKYSLGSLCLAFAVCLIDRAHPRILALLGHPVLVRVGLFSFSIYLWQQPFIRLVEKGHGWLALVGVAICSLSSFYLVEQPARRFLNKRWAKSATGTNATGFSRVATSVA